MGRHAKDTSGGDFAQAPEGTHVGRCVRLIDLGTQHGEYQGEATVRNQVLVTWELPEETTEIDGEQKPMLVSKFYTNSLSEKANLRKDLESWRGKKFTADELMGFDLQTVLNAPAMLSVVHNQKGKAQVAGVMKVTKGMTVPPPVNELKVFWLDEFNQEDFDAISDGIKNIIMQSDEYKGMKNGNGKAAEKSSSIDDFSDDVPF